MLEAILGTGKPLIGMVHLRPLPGAPRFAGDLEAVIAAAVEDARALEAGGIDALLVENDGDAPFTPGPVDPATVAAMAVALRAVRAAVRIPHGVSVLKNDAQAALALSAVTGGRLVRVNIHAGVRVPPPRARARRDAMARGSSRATPPPPSAIGAPLRPT